MIGILVTGSGEARAGRSGAFRGPARPLRFGKGASRPVHFAKAMMSVVGDDYRDLSAGEAVELLLS